MGILHGKQGKGNIFFTTHPYTSVSCQPAIESMASLKSLHFTHRHAHTDTDWIQEDPYTPPFSPAPTGTFLLVLHPHNYNKFDISQIILISLF